MLYKEQKNEELRDRLYNMMVEANCDKNRLIKNFFTYLRSGNSKVNYFIVIRDYFEYMIKENIIECKTMGDITANDVKLITTPDAIEYFDYFSKSHKNSTVTTAIKDMSSFYTYLNNEYDIKNIIKMMPRGRFKFIDNNKVIKLPTKDEITDMINSIETKSRGMKNRVRNEAIIYMFVGSGLRLHELVGLDISDLHLDDETPYVTALRKGYCDAESKMDVYLSGNAVEKLEKWLKIRNNIKTETNALFVGKDGKRITENAIELMMKTHSKGKITPHMLRHYFITSLWNATHDMTFVQDLAGHSAGSSITADTYISTLRDKVSIMRNI